VRLRFSIRAKPGEATADAGAGASVIERVVEVPLSSGEVTIGRGRDAAIPLPFASISGQHARIVRDSGGYRIEDLGSANGTRLGQRRLRPHVAETIAVGDVAHLAGIELRFDGELSGEVPSPDNDRTATLARRLVHDIFEACPPAECARLVVVLGPALGRELALTACGRVFKLGRGEQCDLAIADDDISREHAAFERGVDGIAVRDLGSKNGVEVEGQRIVGERVVRDGEIVGMGKTRLRVVDPEDRYLRQIQEGDGRSQPPPLAASPAVVAARKAEGESVRSHFPVVATAIAVTALFLALGLVLALVFAA
jgi:pSer/pThr/pTyr-binding forkhead associated (FHA) protein